MPRVKLLTAREDVAPEHYVLYAELAALRGRLSGPATVVFHSPALSKPWNDQSEFLHRETVVEPGLYELAVSAAARERNCPYIWSAHAKAARKGGISNVDCHPRQRGIVWTAAGRGGHRGLCAATVAHQSRRPGYV